MSLACGTTMSSRSLIRIRPPRAFAVTSQSLDPGARNMPSTSLRLITVPDTAPPYDCEAHGAACPAVRGSAGARSAGVEPLGTGEPPEPALPAGSAPPAGPASPAGLASPAGSAPPAGLASPANALAPERLGP